MGKVFTIAKGLQNMGALRTGGQGSVYKAQRMGPVITAVKILPTPIHSESEDDRNYQNFLNEVEKLKKVNEIPNPNVVKILGSGITESGSLPFIEMEYVEGPDLEELLKPNHEPIFTIKEVVKLADQLAGALSHCHQVGVKHGDIKSNNVKFNVHSGNYVLLDFGLSVMSDEQRRSSMRHAGAIEFMAPEQNEGNMLFQTDVYSFGVILFELLAGQVPFPLKDNGETARNAVMIAHMETPAPELLELRRQNLPETWSDEKQGREMQVPAWLLNTVYHCLEKLPENRYSNGMELQEAIISGSFSVNPDEPYNIITALKTENEKLQTQLLAFQEQLNHKKSSVNIPKSIFAGLVILLLAAVAFGGYGVFSGKNNVPLQPKDTAKKLTPVVSVSKPAPAKPTKSVVMDTNLVKKQDFTGLNIPDNDSTLNASKKAAQTAHTVKKKHKKKKKFLGIF